VEHLHKSDNVLVNLGSVATLALVLAGVGLEHEGHEVLALAVAVLDVAVGDNLPGALADGVGDGALGLDGLEGEGGDPGEEAEDKHSGESGVLAAHLVLGAPGVGDLDGVGGVADGVEVVAKRDAADDVHGGAGGVLDDVELDGAGGGARGGGVDLVGDAGLEGAGDVVDVGVHAADVVGGKGGCDEGAHALVLPLALYPDEGAAAEAEDEGAEDGRVGVVVRVLPVNVRQSNGVAHDQLDGGGGGLLLASATVATTTTTTTTATINKQSKQLTMSGWPQAPLILNAFPHSLNQARHCLPWSSSNSVFSWPQTREAPA
jgi:hypothetical protein